MRTIDLRPHVLSDLGNIDESWRPRRLCTVYARGRPWVYMVCACATAYVYEM
jgi:hypothetical protein